MNESEKDEREYECSTTLIITGEELNPDEVTQLLHLEPSQSWRRGELKQPSIGNQSVYEFGGWKLFITDDRREQYLEKQLLHWYDLLKPKHEIFHEFNRRGFSLQLDCFITTDEAVSIYLDLELQKKLIKISVDIALSVSA